MMAISAGENAKVYLQIGGRVYDLTGVITQTSLSYVLDDTFTFDLTVIGNVDDMLLTTDTGMAEKAEKMRTQIEWFCEYCGAVNDRKDKECRKCNGHRSFLYGNVF